MIKILETPYAGDIEANLEYARACMKDMLDRGEVPFASHLLYTQVLDDTNEEERNLGILTGFKLKFVEGASTVFYIDKGISPGMKRALDFCRKNTLPYEIRSFNL